MKVGVIGGGQLGRMLALAGIPLGHTFSFFDPSHEAPALAVGTLVTGEYSDEKKLLSFCSSVEVLTYEFENVSPEAATICAKSGVLRPSLEALLTSQDRIKEKSFFRRLGIPTPRFAEVASESDLAPAAESVGLPAVLKTTTLGYDGKGQRVIRSKSDLTDGFKALHREGYSLILEEFIQFDRELSLIAVRALSGDIRFYPLVQNVHREGILRTSRAPAPKVSPSLQKSAEDIVREILERFGYVGVFTLELFEKGGALFANEMAPRVHNSGHWTIEGAVTSQFENHVRAVTGMPLGNTSPRSTSVMVNLIGKIPSLSEILTTPGAHLHQYGKEPRPGRKVGHITVLESESPHFESSVEHLSRLAE